MVFTSPGHLKMIFKKIVFELIVSCMRDLLMAFKMVLMIQVMNLLMLTFRLSDLPTDTVPCSSNR